MSGSCWGRGPPPWARGRADAPGPGLCWTWGLPAGCPVHGFATVAHMARVRGSRSVAGGGGNRVCPWGEGVHGMRVGAGDAGLAWTRRRLGEHRRLTWRCGEAARLCQPRGPEAPTPLWQGDRPPVEEPGLLEGGWIPRLGLGVSSARKEALKILRPGGWGHVKALTPGTAENRTVSNRDGAAGCPGGVLGCRLSWAVSWGVLGHRLSWAVSWGVLGCRLFWGVLGCRLSRGDPGLQAVLGGVLGVSWAAGCSGAEGGFT